jgi:hypothetical protein
MIIPACNSKDPEVNRLFQLVDEKLSELYSLHGSQSPRDAITLQKSTNKPTAGGVYRNSIVRAWCYSTVSAAGDVSIVNSFNVATVTRSGSGIYIYKYSSPPENSKCIGIGGVYSGPASNPFGIYVRADLGSGGSSQINVLTFNNAGAYADCNHMFVVIG